VVGLPVRRPGDLSVGDGSVEPWLGRVSAALRREGGVGRGGEGGWGVGRSGEGGGGGRYDRDPQGLVVGHSSPLRLL